MIRSTPNVTELNLWIAFVGRCRRGRRWGGVLLESDVAGGALVHVFEFYINDDRHSIPTLRLVTASDHDSARELAESIYRESPHHLGIEVWEKKIRVLALGARLASH